MNSYNQDGHLQEKNNTSDQGVKSRFRVPPPTCDSSALHMADKASSARPRDQIIAISNVHVTCLPFMAVHRFVGSNKHLGIEDYKISVQREFSDVLKYLEFHLENIMALYFMNLGDTYELILMYA